MGSKMKTAQEYSTFIQEILSSQHDNMKKIYEETDKEYDRGFYRGIQAALAAVRMCDSRIKE